MNCNGIHCPGCGHGGGAAGGGMAAVIALVVIVALALRKAWPAIVTAVEITAWTVAGICGAAVVITAGVLIVRAARRRAATARRSPVVIQGTRLYPPLPPAARPGLEPPRSRAAGPWPLPGRWEEIGPRTGGDGDEHRR
jgi:hypothetical protein